MILNVHHLSHLFWFCGTTLEFITSPVLRGGTIPAVKGTRQKLSLTPAHTLRSLFPPDTCVHLVCSRVTVCSPEYYSDSELSLLFLGAPSGPRGWMGHEALTQHLHLWGLKTKLA